MILGGHNGRCDTLSTVPPLNGVQEVGGLPEGTNLRRRDPPLAPTGRLSSLPQCTLYYKFTNLAIRDLVETIFILEILNMFHLTLW